MQQESRCRELYKVSAQGVKVPVFLLVITKHFSCVEVVCMKCRFPMSAGGLLRLF